MPFCVIHTKQATCEETETYHPDRTAPSKVQKSLFFNNRKMLIINTCFLAKTSHTPQALIERKTPFALIRKVRDFAGLGSQVHWTCSQDFTTSEPAIMTAICPVFSSPSTRCRTSIRVCRHTPIVRGIQ